MSWIHVEAEALKPQLLVWRRHLHQNPELSFQERETAEFIAAQLRELGIPHVQTRIGGKHGVCATIGASVDAPAVVLRADIDALPIQEKSSCSTPSLTPGIAHLCGHDAHTTMLLGAALLLQKHRELLPQPVRLFFQHAEEQSPGGAVDFIQAGLMEGAGSVFGLHVDPRMHTGQIGISPGRLMAGASSFDMTISGVGGHAAFPHLTTDPIVAASDLILAFQHLVSRRLNPLEEAVISVTKFHGGRANNVIPDEVEIGGTFRSYRPDWHEYLSGFIRETTESIMALHRCEASIHFRRGYCPLWNDEEAARHLASVVESSIPALEVVPAIPMMGGEDFAFYLREAPGCFAFIGCTAAGVENAPMLHHPEFLLDEEVLPLGTSVLASVALERFGGEISV